MIARELLVKLGFDIDSSKLDKFNASIDATKNKMLAIRNSSLQSISSASSGKLLKNYNDELASLSKSERADILALNRLENQAIKETTKDIWKEIVLEFYNFLEFFYIDWGYHKVLELVEIKNNTVTEKCASVIFTQDKLCKKLPKPISPNKKFFATHPIGGSDKEFDKMVGTYLPYIYKLLDGLV